MTAISGQRAADKAYIGLPGPTLEGLALELVSQYPPAGVVLFKRNVGPDPGPIRDLISQLQDISQAKQGREMSIAIDQEGGTVKRLPPPFGQYPDAASYGPDGEDAVRRWGRDQGRELAELGLTMNFAPVVDVNTLGREGIMNRRAFGVDPATVARLGAAAIKGLHQAGLAACAKHFPGIGHSTLDSHLVRPVYDRSRAEMESCELIPFIAAIRAGVEAVMISHLVYPALDPGNPASLSPTVMTGLLRRELGFSGLIMTDDLDMGAITTDLKPHQAARKALAAGADIVLLCQDIGSYDDFVKG